ncbi:ATP-binding protein [Methylotuvimicrobium buryatense]|uniref:ATP-binding protein n=1 Tax=Methylotuvimicrobium buryatense TaxID=95641 RepID=A0A4P9UMV6_METBY|nr:ATP-binding protein [Methylotuvimicrobium buryatense]QCW82634.1 ATP-binding protein [Methylotuvimicrobium buryatense]
MLKESTVSNGVVRTIIVIESDIADAMRQTRALATQAGFGRIAVCYIATAVVELTTNLLIHAGGGYFEAEIAADGRWITLVAKDNGPGIADINLALTDGFSTVGGLGCGLPGVMRLMEHIEIKTQIGIGTCVVARKSK